MTTEAAHGMRPEPAAGPRLTGPLIALVVFAAVTALGLVRHSLWLDETQSWAIARSSRNLGELWSNLRYEGHPPLWHLLLFLVTRVSHDVRAMQVLQWVIATAGAGIVLFRAPWRLLVRIALCASYFLAFEYAVLSRSYGLSVLLLAVALVTRPRSTIWTAALALLCFTSVFGIALAVAVVVGAAVRPSGRLAIDRSVILAGAIVATAALLAGLSAIPPADSRSGAGFGEPLSSDVSIRGAVALTGVAEGLAPVPEIPPRWNQTSLREIPVRFRALVGMLLVGAVTAAIWRSRRALVVWLVGLALLLAMFVAVYPPRNLRHSGHVALLLLAALWVGERDQPVVSLPRPGRLLIAGLLGVTATAGVLTVGVYLNRDFGDVQSTADVIARRAPGARLISVADLASTPVGAYLDTPVYSAALRRPIRFVRYDLPALWAKFATAEQLDADVRLAVGCARRPVVVIGDHRRAAVLASLGGRRLASSAVLLPRGWGCAGP
jgi:hypothetical protein